MTVKELMDNLQYYEFDDDVEVESWTENKYGMKEVEIRKKLKPSFIGTVQGNCWISLEVDE